MIMSTYLTTDLLNNWLNRVINVCLLKLFLSYFVQFTLDHISKDLTDPYVYFSDKI